MARKKTGKIMGSVPIKRTGRSGGGKVGEPGTSNVFGPASKKAGGKIMGTVKPKRTS